MEDEAFLVDELESGFSVECSNGIHTARAVVIATGKQRKKPDIQGLADYESRGASYCATCDGAFYQNKRIAVLGSYACREAGALAAYSAHITILTNEDKAMFDTTYKVDTRKISDVLGENKLTGVRFSDGEEMPLDALFIAIETAGSSDFAKRLGLEERDGSIKIARSGTTNVPGLFAAGDCTGGLLQLAKAAAECAAVGSTVIDFLKARHT